MKIVFYVGKAYPHRANLERIKSAGYELGLFHDPNTTLKHEDLFSYVVPLDFSSEQAFVDSLAHVTDVPRIDGLLCSYENYIVFKSLAAEKLSVPALTLDAARASTDKYVMRQKFLDYDPAITPKFVLVESKESLLAFAREAQYPLIMKPTNLVKSLLVSKCSSEAELIEAYDETMRRIDDAYKQAGVTNREPAIIVEEFIHGTMCSVAGFTDNDGTVYLCDGIVRLTTAQEIGYNDNFLYARTLTDELPAAVKARILSVAEKGIKALGMTASPAHVEIIYNENEVKLVEIGARIGGYRPFLYEQSYGIHMLDQELAIAVGERPNLNGDMVRNSAMYELFPKTESTFVRLDGAKDPSSYDYFHLVATPGKRVGPAKNGYKAAAIIGIADEDLASFNARTSEVDLIKVITE